MLKVPKTGEYWYMLINNDRIDAHFTLVYCVGTIDKSALVKVYFVKNDTGYWSNQCYLCNIHSENAVKWEPKWYHRLLGYK